MVFYFCLMEYIELDCTVEPAGENTEILIARLAAIGYSMFEESEKGVKAYIESGLFSQQELDHLAAFPADNPVKIEYKISKMPDVNWNELWESNFQPVIIGKEIYVRAEYHQPDPSFKFELVIQPRMAFGTGHHATTSLVMESMLTLDFKDKTVLDMGCGTGILAILASKMGATHLVAVDIDDNATENTVVNCRRNNVQNVKVITGGAAASGKEKFDFVLANINRNIILEDLPLYMNNLNAGGILITSGYYESDLEIISDQAAAIGLKLNDHKVSENWCRATFIYEKF